MVKLQVYVPVPVYDPLLFLLQHVYAPESLPSSNSDIIFYTMEVQKWNESNKVIWVKNFQRTDNKVQFYCVLRKACSNLSSQANNFYFNKFNFLRKRWVVL